MEYRIGDILTGKVTGVQPYGAFVMLDVKDTSDIFTVGQRVEVVILDIDEYTQKISLSLRALQASPRMSKKRRRKHYWTSRKFHTGFAPIAARLDGWVAEALDHLDEEPAHK